MKRTATVLILSLALGACTDSSTPGNVQFESTVQAGDFDTNTYTSLRSGQMTMTLLWSDAGVDLDLYLTALNCAEDDDLLADCTILASSTDTGTDVEQVTRPIVTGDQFRIWVRNSSQQSISYKVRIRVESFQP